MPIKASVATVVALSTLTACSQSSGFLREATTAHDFHYSLDIAGEEYSRTVSGSATRGLVFCFIPTSDVALYRDAMADLQKRAHLQRNEVLGNIREDRVSGTFLLYCQEDLVVSADVYDVIPLPKEGASASIAQAPNFRGATFCDLAVASLGDELIEPLRALYPKARYLEHPSRDGFLAACGAQSEIVQLCLQAPYLRGHAEACRSAFAQASEADRTRLFGTFLAEW